MQEKELIVGTSLTAFLLLLWLGFFVHRDPAFPGSLWGGVLAVTGSTLFLVPLFYSAVKRIGFLKTFVTRYVSFRTLLAWHIYASLIGAILVLLHTGHKFESPAASLLTAFLLIVVVSGYIGRYLLVRLSQESREKKAMEAILRNAFRSQAEALRQHSEDLSLLEKWPRWISVLSGAWLLKSSAPVNQTAFRLHRFLRTTEALSDVQYAIKSHEWMKHAFSRWLKLHLFISGLFYLLLFFHIAYEIYFGLRWFR